MYKLIDTASFYHQDEPTVTVIDFNEGKGLVKQAADSRISEFASSITPEPGKIYVHILAMGAGEYFGANRNADYFPENNLIDYHQTFVTSPAHIFRNHVNKNPAIAIGQVIFSIYNHRMHRVEVIAWIDKEKAPDVVDRIARGEWPATSMACKTPYDVCSICGNKASTRDEYCEHLSTQLGRVYPDGRKVMALNVAPLKFFDMSIVVRSADVTSSVLQKVANEYGQIVGSAEMAEAENLLEAGIQKQATIQKLSEFIKEVDGDMVDYAEDAKTLIDKVKDPDLKLVDSLINFKLHEVLSTMADLGISPSISFLAELIARKTLGESAEGAGAVVEGLIKEIGAENVQLPLDEPTDHPSIHIVAKMLMPSLEGSSYLPQFVEKRAMIMQGTNVGYVGNGPHIEPTPYEKFRAMHLTEDKPQSTLVKMVQALLTIGGAALAAKWYITRAIEQKINQNSNAGNDGVKILLVKSASDAVLTYKLAKAAMVKAIKSK